MTDIFEQLKRPFPLNRIHWRLGATNGEKTSGIGLAYIDARDAMQRLDEVLGPQGWQCRYPLADSGLLVCEIGIKVGDEWLWKANGAGDTQVEADKGKCSDAFKRAAVLWGIGRYLYALPNIWVPIKKKGNSYTLPDSSIDLLNSRLPSWASPEGFDAAMKKRSNAA